jgi:hypothetical protein
MEISIVFSKLLPNVGKEKQLHYKGGKAYNFLVGIDIILQSREENHPAGTVYHMPFLLTGNALEAKGVVVLKGPEDSEGGVADNEEEDHHDGVLQEDEVEREPRTQDS